MGHKITAREKTCLFPEVKRKSDFERTGWSQKEKRMQSSALFTGLCRFRVHLHSPMTDPSSRHMHRYNFNPTCISGISQLVPSKMKPTAILLAGTLLAGILLARLIHFPQQKTCPRATSPHSGKPSTGHYPCTRILFSSSTPPLEGQDTPNSSLLFPLFLWL